MDAITTKCQRCGREIHRNRGPYVKFALPDRYHTKFYLCWDCWGEVSSHMGAKSLLKLLGRKPLIDAKP
jgi:DNA-directed RNA polymerase subunit RPC12/RpoP